MRASLVSGVLGAGLAFALIAMTTGIDGGSGAAPGAAKQDPGRAVFARMGCGSCHTLAAAGSRGEMGPDLDQRLPAHTRASLVERITRGPAADGTFSPMPDNFRDRLDDDELDALVDFLLAARSAR
jgi:mono/diheme cytochrome c family protein